MASYTIEQVLPHQHPMILIDSLESYDQSQACCLVTITENSAFYCPEKLAVPSYIGCEYMAQAIAAFAGAKALDQQQPVKIGFLLGSRKYQTSQAYFPLHAQLKVVIEELYQEDSGLSVFQCSITHDHKQLAQAKINVFQPDDSQAFLQGVSEE